MPQAKTGLIDAHGRVIDYLRLSLTDRCNFRCVYCMPPDGAVYMPHCELPTYEELLRLCLLMSGLGIRRFKITGGEPLCRKGAVAFIRRLKRMPGVDQVTLTSNGTLLAPYVEELADIGVSGINFSLNSLNPEHYAAVSRTQAGPEQVLPVMAAAAKAGITVKINVVPLRTYNDCDLPDLTRFALENGYHIRFIELMPVGLGAACTGVPPHEIHAAIERDFGPLSALDGVAGNGPANYFRVPGHAGSVGFISAVSNMFCPRCNRIRLTSGGFLKSCLHRDAGVELKPLLRSGANDAAIIAALRKAIMEKPAGHAFGGVAQENFRQRFLMHSIGG
jgi:cyclic pyranopterin phosphate synthase